MKIGIANLFTWITLLRLRDDWLDQESLGKYVSTRRDSKVLPLRVGLF